MPLPKPRTNHEEAPLEKLIYSIAKDDVHKYILENIEENKYYYFNDFSEIIDVFSDTDTPHLFGFKQGKATSSSKNKIKIHKRMAHSLGKGQPKYFWSQSYNNFDYLEISTVKDVLKHVKKNMRGW